MQLQATIGPGAGGGASSHQDGGEEDRHDAQAPRRGSTPELPRPSEVVDVSDTLGRRGEEPAQRLLGALALGRLEEGRAPRNFQIKQK